MTFNQETIQGKWLEIKGEVLKSWGKITNDEIDKTKGDAMAIAGLVQQKYGEGKEEFQKKLDSTSTLKIAFAALTPGRQRAYILYFSAPRQAKTRLSRIENCISKILNGKGLNDA